MTTPRAQWGSRLGFILAASGSAVGLGNIWKFPYITGENGGGLFVLIYLVCIALIGLPIMMAEIFIGRESQCSPVGAFRSLSKRGSPWILSGWLGVATGLFILSFYAVVAGWSMHYIVLSLANSFDGKSPDDINAMFGDVASSASINVGWHLAFMAITIAIVIGGIKTGIERAARILMPLLFVMLIAMLIRATTTSGFPRAFNFVFGFHNEDLTATGVLEALGHAFFTLSLGMGAMITYGSYLKRNDDLVGVSLAVSVLDTLVALLACLVLFPIVFTHDMEPGSGPGLVFQSMPIAFSQMAGGGIWATIFFVLLFFAALTSAISLLEVVASYFIDERNWPRWTAAVVCGGFIALLGVPSALANGGAALFSSDMAAGPIGKDWMTMLDDLTSQWMLPLGGLFIAMFVAWRVGGAAREKGFKNGTRFSAMYGGWVFLLRYLVPIGVLAVFLNKIGVFAKLGWM